MDELEETVPEDVVPEDEELVPVEVVLLDDVVPVDVLGSST